MKKLTYFFKFCLLTAMMCVFSTKALGTVTYSLNTTTKTLTFSGTGAMDDYTDPDGSGSPRRPATWVFNVQTVVIEEGVTSIGEWVFAGLTNFKYVYIPTSVTKISERAFSGCTVLQKIYYAGTPDQWAQIDFEVAGSYCYSHPFNASTASARKYYFYNQTTTETVDLTFTNSINQIKQYAFYRANDIVDVYIPGTVTNIGTHALDCAIKRLYINKSVAPTTGTTAISWLTSSTYIYLRSDATNSYDKQPWINTSSGTSTGAKNVGYGDYSYVSCGWRTGKLHKVSGTVNSINWSLSEDGTLTLSGSGAIATTFTTSTASDNSALLPWYRFRRLINKIIIEGDEKGDITDLSNGLAFCWATYEIEIKQNKIPAGSFDFATDFKKTSDIIVLKVPYTALSDANLESAPWNNDKMVVTLSNVPAIADNADNSAMLSLLKNKAEAPFSLTLSRTLRNVSFNSFCSPVDMSAEQVTDIFGPGTEIYTLVSSSYDPIANELALNLSDNQTAIEAGKPYVIKPANDAPTITIADVAPSTVATAAQTIETDVMDFHGLLNPYTLSSGDKFLVVSSGNELNWTESGTLKGMRSYFTLKPGVPAQAMAAKARLVFADESPEAITNIEVEQPVQKIMRNGQLLIVRDGVTYNTMGQIVE